MLPWILVVDGDSDWWDGIPETGETPSQVSRDCRRHSRQVVGTHSDGTVVYFIEHVTAKPTFVVPAKETEIRVFCFYISICWLLIFSFLFKRTV